AIFGRECDRHLDGAAGHLDTGCDAPGKERRHSVRGDAHVRDGLHSNRTRQSGESRRPSPAMHARGQETLMRLPLPETTTAPRPPLRFPSKDGLALLPPSLAPSPDDPAQEILRFAETLGIPWRRILLGEIEAEQRLRQYLENIQEDCPLPTVLKVLSSNFLDS